MYSNGVQPVAVQYCVCDTGAELTVMEGKLLKYWRISVCGRANFCSEREPSVMLRLNFQLKRSVK